MSYILVTGGAGYIGSHTVVELVEQGFNVVIVDNLSNSSYDSIARIQFLKKTSIPFYEIDLINYDELCSVFEKYPISSVIHFAGLKAVGESTKLPLKYYHNNIVGSINLLQAMDLYNVTSLVFSSSATVYGEVTPEYIPIPETCPLLPTNPYGKTKLTIEYMIQDYAKSHAGCHFAILRYFNPVGAHPSGLIGEDPLGVPNNLLPFLAQVAVGRQAELKIFGDDYDSKDGSLIRDYIHVMDLAKGHISALNYLNSLKHDICREWNLGTGIGSTVFDMYNAFNNVIGKKLPYEVIGRRLGDVLNLTADPKIANLELNWKATMDVSQACKDLWNWTSQNPYGFQNANYSSDFFSAEKSFESRLHTVKTFNGNFEVAIANYGATIVSAKLNGIKVCLGFENEEGYKRLDNPFFGATIGRIANRVGKGELVIDDETYHLPLNENTTSLHGGNHGFDKRLFLGPIVKQDLDAKETSLKFILIDSDGDSGYPGDLETVITYIVRDVPDGGELVVEYEAKLLKSSKRTKTGVNLTNHSYWNISGNADNSELSIDGTEVKLISNNILEVDNDLIPTGKIIPLPGQNGEIISLKANGPAVDNCFIATNPQGKKLDTRSDKLQLIAECTNSQTNIKFLTFSTEPAFQLYTGDGINVSQGPSSRAGFCIEASKYIYHPSWFTPLTLNDVYGSQTVYRFTQ